MSRVHTNALSFQIARDYFDQIENQMRIETNLDTIKIYESCA